MNKELENHIFPIPPNVLNFLRQQPESSSIDRTKHLLANGMVTYGQLKRILHDMKVLDKKADPQRYNLYGGKPLEDWGKSILKQHRDTIKNTKEIIVNKKRGLAWENGIWNGYDPVKGDESMVNGNYSAMWTKESGKWKIKSQLFVTLAEM